MNKPVLENLDPDQLEAVLYFDSPLLILAGAGSGKTKVITNKIAYLVTQKNYSPWNILGLTFTNKAADEMKKRVESLTGIESRLFNISTFHSLGLRLLRESGIKAGFSAKWQVIDDNDQQRIIEKIIKDRFNHYSNEKRNRIIRKINMAKMHMIYPNNIDLLSQYGMTEEEQGIFSHYFEFQKRNELWDYEDLVSLSGKMLQTHDDIFQKYRQKFFYVLVDEFQDTNPNQYELIKLLAQGHQAITVVGDDDQAIYSWRGANIRFLFDFEYDFPQTSVVKLEKNYRSTPQILNLANKLISGNMLRRPKSMWTENNQGSPVYFLPTFSKETEASEIAELVSFIQKNCPDLLPLAILYRINSQSLLLETELSKHHIKFEILKGQRFFERKEIKDSLALLKLALNHDDDLAFLRMIDFLPLGIGEKSLSLLTAKASETHQSLFLTLKDFFNEKYQRYDIFSTIYELNQKKDSISYAEMMSILLQKSAYLEILHDKTQESRILNIEEWVEFLKKWEESNPGQNYSLLIDIISLNMEKNKGNGSTQVFLLTMHNAKGLEFPTVIVVGINRMYMPFYLRNERMEIEEERRLFYVACTRAQKQLIVSSGSLSPSPFLAPIERAAFFKEVTDLEDLRNKLRPGKDDWTKSNDPEIFYGGKRIEHPLFGQGKVVHEIDESKMIVDFDQRGRKMIDTSVVKIKFLATEKV